MRKEKQVEAREGWVMFLRRIVITLVVALIVGGGLGYAVGQMMAPEPAERIVEREVERIVRETVEVEVERIVKETVEVAHTETETKTKIERTKYLDATPRLGIMSAFGAELELLKAETEIENEYVINGHTWTTGRLRGHDVVLVLSGVSMEPSAGTVDKLTDNFNVERIIFSGIAGGVDDAVHIGDVTIPGAWAAYQKAFFARKLDDGSWGMGWHDQPFANFGMSFPQQMSVFVEGGTPDETVKKFWFEVDRDMFKVAESVAKDVTLNDCTSEGVCLEHAPRVLVGGTGVSGPTFVDNAAFRRYTYDTFVHDKFGHVAVLDMETAAFMIRCYTNGKRCLAFRSASDLAGGGEGENQIGTFFGIAADNSAKVVLAFLEALPVEGPPAPERRTAILVGFGWEQDGAWLGEIKPYMEVLEVGADVTTIAPLCQGPIFQGMIYGEPVLMVVAGTAKVQMATCVQNLLQNFPEIDEVVLTAIAGISPMRGGMVDLEGNFRDSDQAQPGDGCVSYFADDFDLQFLDTDKLGLDAWWTGRWKRPPVVGSKELADELLAAAEQVEWPEVPEAPRQNILKYHDTVRKAKMWGYWESIEMTDDLFWHGVIGDARAREMGAWAISQILETDTSPEDIVICTTMEAVPMLKVVSQWNETHNTNIRAAYIRGASNFDHPWLNADGTAAVSGRESIESGMEMGGGVDYSAVTEALPMIKMLELRSQKGAVAPEEFVVGCIYVGPHNDHGWSEAHHMACQRVVQEIPNARLIFLDKLNPSDRPETTLEQIVDDMVAQGAKLIFTTSDDFQADTDPVAQKYTDVVFINISGDHAKTGEAPPNVGNYMGKMEYMKAVAGCAAALNTETNTIGYLGPLINDETRRLAASAYLGSRYCYEKYRAGDPDELRFIVKWIGFWFNIPGVTLDPTEVSNDIFNEGADVILSGIDTTEALVVAKQRGKRAIPYDYENACDEAPSVCLGVPYFNWGPGYIDIANRVREGTWSQHWTWAAGDAAGFAYGSALSEDDRVLVAEFMEGITSGDLGLFVGPLNYQDGSVYLTDGEVATDDQIWYFSQLLQGMEGPSE